MRPTTISTHIPSPTSMFPVQTTSKSGASKDPLGCDYPNNRGCPVTHTEFNGKCFLISDTPIDFISGKLYCAHHCSLISEDFSSVIRQVIRFSREQLHDQSTSVYIGVQDKNQDGHFTWISSGSPAFPPQTPRQGKYCATLNIDSMRPTAVTCTEMYYVLCEAFYRS
ncbi:uncharacterized protein LOC130053263 isoform X2 [Ostrea edulis]|uniref:uncharacterized protein LOC130053263 isoform X2 n=1 Tax=Ostrea edulis TaxID=37623 RepID=UPI0024AF9F61|nr:uncharacterized protein LOC130053263 isoform X2 [Ostrea edulis]